MYIKLPQPFKTRFINNLHLNVTELLLVGIFVMLQQSLFQWILNLDKPRQTTRFIYKLMIVLCWHYINTPQGHQRFILSTVRLKLSNKMFPYKSECIVCSGIKAFASAVVSVVSLLNSCFQTNNQSSYRRSETSFPSCNEDTAWNSRSIYIPDPKNSQQTQNIAYLTPSRA